MKRGQIPAPGLCRDFSGLPERESEEEESTYAGPILGTRMLRREWNGITVLAEHTLHALVAHRNNAFLIMLSDRAELHKEQIPEGKQHLPAPPAPIVPASSLTHPSQTSRES